MLPKCKVIRKRGINHWWGVQSIHTIRILKCFLYLGRSLSSLYLSISLEHELKNFKWRILHVYTIFNRIKLTIWTICAFRVLNNNVLSLLHFNILVSVTTYGLCVPWGHMKPSNTINFGWFVLFWKHQHFPCFKLIKTAILICGFITQLTAYLLFSTFRSDKYFAWIVNKYVIFFDNDCMMFGNESTRNKINKIKQYYIVVLILHSCLLSILYVLFITKWDIRKREDFFKFYTVTISYNGTQFSWFCKFLEMFNI